MMQTGLPLRQPRQPELPVRFYFQAPQADYNNSGNWFSSKGRQQLYFLSLTRVVYLHFHRLGTDGRRNVGWRCTTATRNFRSNLLISHETRNRVQLPELCIRRDHLCRLSSLKLNVSRHSFVAGVIECLNYRTKRYDWKMITRAMK